MTTETCGICGRPWQSDDPGDPMKECWHNADNDEDDDALDCYRRGYAHWRARAEKAERERDEAVAAAAEYLAAQKALVGADLSSRANAARRLADAWSALHALAPKPAKPEPAPPTGARCRRCKGTGTLSCLMCADNVGEHECEPRPCPKCKPAKEQP